MFAHLARDDGDGTTGFFWFCLAFRDDRWRTFLTRDALCESPRPGRRHLRPTTATSTRSRISATGNPRPKRNHFLVQNGTASGLEAGPFLVENGTACVQGSSWWQHHFLLTSTCSCSRGPLSCTVRSPGETEAGSAETQPDQGIARPTVCRWHSAAPKGFALLGALCSPIGHQSPCLGKSRGSGGRAPRAASSPRLRSCPRLLCGPSLLSSTLGSGNFHHSSRRCDSGVSVDPATPPSSDLPGRSAPIR